MDDKIDEAIADNELFLKEAEDNISKWKTIALERHSVKNMLKTIKDK